VIFFLVVVIKVFEKKKEMIFKSRGKRPFCSSFVVFSLAVVTKIRWSVGWEHAR
jgi:hypothetical protein